MSEKNDNGKIVITSSDVEGAAKGKDGAYKKPLKGAVPPPSSQPEKALNFGNVSILISMALALLFLSAGAGAVGSWERRMAPPSDYGDGDVASALPDGPAAVCLVVDRSGSMSGSAMVDARNAAIDFVSSLDSDDELAIIDFASDIRVSYPLQQVGDGNAARAAIQRIQASGMTALWDAGIQGVQALSRASEDRERVMILFTDGMDNSSRMSADDLIRRANDADVTIHVVALGSFVDHAALNRVASATAGSSTYAQRSGQLGGIFRGLGRTGR